MSHATALEAENAHLRQIVDLLKQQVEWLKKQLYGGGKSEKLNRAQLLLQLEELETKVAEAQTQSLQFERRVPKARQHEAPAERFKDLPVEETVVIEPEEVLAEPEAFEKIAEESTFEVDIKPPKLFKRQIIRPKYRRKADREQPPVVAPAPKRPIEGGYASAGLLAWVVLEKYVHHMPLYRQEKASAMWGAALSRKTMADWVEAVAEWLKPLYNYMKNELLAGGYVQADETPVRYCDPDQKNGKTGQGWLWAISKPGGNVVFDWRLTRRHGELTSLLDGFQGLLQSDAYGAYDGFAREGGAIALGCLAHARRKFYDALSTSRREATLVLKLIARLYALEQHYRDERLDADQRQTRRQAEQPRLLKWLHLAIRISQQRALPKSPLGKATAYALAQWPNLTRYLDYGEAEIDNNLMENAIRPSALGKKNFLFIGHPEAGQRSAIIYSLVVSCQRHGLNPHAYLRNILTRLPQMTNQHDLRPLLPDRWKNDTSTT